MSDVYEVELCYVDCDPNMGGEHIEVISLEEYNEKDEIYWKYEPFCFLNDGDLVWIKFLKNGKEHNEHGPAETYFDFERPSQSWYIDGMLHREDGPAVIVYNHDSNSGNENNFCWIWEEGESDYRRLSDTYEEFKEEEWYLNGKQHREDGPARICYDDDGSFKQWYINGELHREDGPAYICYNDDGSVSDEYWYLNGKEHREDGPADIWYNDDGSVEREKWYLNGEELSEEEFNKRMSDS